MVSLQDTYMNTAQFEFLEVIPEAHVKFHFRNLFWFFCIYISVCQYVSCYNTYCDVVLDAAKGTNLIFAESNAHNSNFMGHQWN